MGHHGIDLVYSNDRRQCVDRRERIIKAEFPLVDSDGRYIKADRRNAPDRRLANIQVKEVSLDRQSFTTLFCSR